MKVLVPVASLLLGGAALLMRREAPASEPAARAVELPRTAAPARECAVAGSTPVTTSAAPAAVAPQAMPAMAESSRRVAQATLRRVTDLLRQALTPNDEQLAGIRRILDDRSRAVAAYESEVHQRGWARLHDFDHRIGQIREMSYRRILALLDAEQARTFHELRPTLLAKDYLEISIPDDKVVCLD